MPCLSRARMWAYLIPWLPTSGYRLPPYLSTLLETASIFKTTRQGQPCKTLFQSSTSAIRMVCIIDSVETKRGQWLRSALALGGVIKVPYHLTLPSNLLGHLFSQAPPKVDSIHYIILPTTTSIFHKKHNSPDDSHQYLPSLYQRHHLGHSQLFY